MSLNEGLDPELVKKLDTLRVTAPRSAEKAALGRAAFLEQAQRITRAVSKTGERRPNGWMHALQSIFTVPRKEHSPMFSPLITILVAVSLVLGGGSLTVVGAQSSQPDQPLYGVKLLSEQARLQLASNTETALQLQLEFTERRAAEIQAMFQAGKVPSDAIQNRYQSQVEQVMRLAVGMADPQAIQALEQIRLRLQSQLQAFLQPRPNAIPQVKAALERVRQMIQQHLQWVEEGLADPSRLRNQLQQQQKLQPGGNGGPARPSPMGSTAMPGNPGMGGGNPWTTGTPTPGSGYGPGPGTGECTSCTPGIGGMMGNPWTTGTPTPGSGYGDGMGGNPWTTGTPTPGSGYGGGTGSNPWTTGTPTPGSGYGPGPGPMPTQTMGGGDGMGPGPGPSQTPGSGQGTGPGPMPTQQGPGPQPTSGMGGGGMHP